MFSVQEARVYIVCVVQVEGQPLCSLPNVCPLTTAELPGETIRLHTCGQCPNKYPWLLDPEGAGFSRS